MSGSTPDMHTHTHVPPQWLDVGIEYQFCFRIKLPEEVGFCVHLSEG